MIINDGSVLSKETKVIIFAKFPKKTPKVFQINFIFINSNRWTTRKVAMSSL